jgi:UDP-N-acetylglucosamine enolpyruvyl transferase
MYICQICGLTVNKGDIISIISSGVRSLSNDAEYNFIPDFLEKEVIYHYNCFSECFSNKKINNTNTLDIKNIYNTLEQMGESIDIKNIIDFVIKNKPISSEEEFITKWFSNRNKLN